MLTKNKILSILSLIVSVPSLAHVNIDNNHPVQKNLAHQHQHQHQHQHKTKHEKKLNKLETKEMNRVLFKYIDKDSNGKISKDEFIIHQEGKFKRLDKNNDGFIQKEELRHREIKEARMNKGLKPHQ